MYSYLMSPTTNSAVAMGPDFFCTGGEGMTHDLIQYNKVGVKWFIF